MKTQTVMRNAESTINLPDAEIDASYSDDEYNLANSPPSVNTELEHSEGNTFNSLRRQIKDITYGQKYQFAVVALVLIDAAIVVAVLIIDSSIDGRTSHALRIIKEVLHYTSICILALFLIEIIVKLIAFGLVFFKHKLEVLDASIVIVSFVLDIVTIHGGVETAFEFIILLRLWRIARIINGVTLSIKKKTEKAMKHLSMENTELHDQLQQLELKLTAQKKEIQYLRNKLTSFGVEIDENSQMQLLNIL